MQWIWRRHSVCRNMTLVHVNYCTNRLIRHCLPSRIFLDPCISNSMDIQFGLNDPVFSNLYICRTGCNFCNGSGSWLDSKSCKSNGLREVTILKNIFHILLVVSLVHSLPRHVCLISSTQQIPDCCRAYFIMKADIKIICLTKKIFNCLQILHFNLILCSFIIKRTTLYQFLLQNYCSVFKTFNWCQFIPYQLHFLCVLIHII